MFGERHAVLYKLFSLFLMHSVCNLALSSIRSYVRRRLRRIWYYIHLTTFKEYYCSNHVPCPPCFLFDLPSLDIPFIPGLWLLAYNDRFQLFLSSQRYLFPVLKSVPMNFPEAIQTYPQTSASPFSYYFLHHHLTKALVHAGNISRNLSISVSSLQYLVGSLILSLKYIPNSLFFTINLR